MKHSAGLATFGNVDWLAIFQLFFIHKLSSDRRMAVFALLAIIYSGDSLAVGDLMNLFTVSRQKWRLQV